MLDRLVSLQPVLFDKMQNLTKAMALIKKMCGTLSATTMIVVGVESSFYRCNITKNNIIYCCCCCAHIYVHMLKDRLYKLDSAQTTINAASVNIIIVVNF